MILERNRNLSIFRKICQRFYCGNCKQKNRLYKIISEINSRNKELECKDKIYKNFELFNEKGVAIVSIVPLQSHIIVITKECRNRVYHFYEKHGFLITDQKDIILELYQQN